MSTSNRRAAPDRLAPRTARGPERDDSLRVVHQTASKIGLPDAGA
jgi:hypothetical protein